MKFGAKCCRGEACSPATHCEADIREVVTWYRERDPALADRFLNEVHKTLAMLEAFPGTGGVVFGVVDINVRQLPIDNFPAHGPRTSAEHHGDERLGDGMNRQ